MPRPLRIEYPDAYYHVMNRGRDGGRQNLFHAKDYYEVFLNTLSESVERFGIIVHAYCLMRNHYHLLIQTPEPNLGRVMRQINGVYTQRHNRLKNTDGPLFRGRYQAILVEHDAYLLQLSRYIHRNPIETKKPLVSELSQYVWSSYPAYINQVKSPEWLYREQIYGMLGSKQKYQGYQRYVAQGVDQQLKEFYKRGNTASVMGDKQFLDWLKAKKLPELEDKIYVAQVLPRSLTMEHIVEWVAQYFKVTTESLTGVRKGPQKANLPRKLAMYYCQQLGGYHLDEISQYFGLSHIGSVSFITSQIRTQTSKDIKLVKQIALIKRFIIENAT